MTTGLPTPRHWLSRRFSRHWNAIDLSFQSLSASLSERFLVSPTLEPITSPSHLITYRAEHARKVLDELFGYEALLRSSLADLSQSHIDYELLGDVISQVVGQGQGQGQGLDGMRGVWALSQTLFLALAYQDQANEPDLSQDQKDIACKAKLFFLANMSVNMLQIVLQYFLQFSFKNDEYLRYWEEREIEYKHWYWIETTPLFWGRYLLQKYSLSKHSDSSTPTPQANSTLRSQYNTTTTTPPHIHNNGTPQTHKRLLHPKQALAARLRTLRTLRHSIAHAVGRLTVLLSEFRNVQTIEDTQKAIDQTITHCRVILSLFDKSDHSSTTTHSESTTTTATATATPTPTTASHSTTAHTTAHASTTTPSSNEAHSEHLIPENLLAPSGELSNEWFARAFTQIGEITDSFKTVFISLSVQLKTTKIPNWFSTHWMHIGAGSVIVYMLTKQVYMSRASIVQYIKDTRDAAVRFWQEHLEVPLRNIWEAIRYDKTTLSVANKVSLQQDVESLERMVASFAKDKDPSLSSEDILKLMKAAEEGDLSLVMKAYEQNIVSPIKSVIFGDLIRLVLIQVQKQKVDLEKAMEALDQLLRANELNFQFLATIPAVLLIGGIVFQLRHLFRSKTPNSALYASIHTDMRNLERMLNVGVRINEGAEGNIGGLTYETYGLLLHITTKLQFMAERLAGRNKVWFEEDLQEIESEKTDTSQKLATIQRMYHTYQFLHNNKK